MVNNTYHLDDLKNALIKSGVEILAKEGVSGLSVRKTARKAGVSHAAPYTHFSDKQGLSAALNTEGHLKIYKKIKQVMEQYPNDPLMQLVEVAWAQDKFGMEEPDHF